MSKVGVDDFLVNGGDLNDLPVVSFTPKIAPEAFYGIAGRIVAAISPQSEADPVAILAHILVAAANVIGRGPHALVEKTEHTCGEFVVLVGDSAKGRKGQAWSVVRSMLSQIDEPWATTRIRSGLSSGEGLIYNVRDQREEKQPIKEKNRVVDYQQVVVDEGEPDKRLFVIEPEFATTLRRMKGETNTLSPAIREAWDSGNLSVLTKNSPVKATGAHISIIAHTTADELITDLTETDRANGFANRFLYLIVRRSKCLPEPEEISPAVLAPLTEELRRRTTPLAGVIRRNDKARALWESVYPKLSEGEPGLLGAILARAEAHVLRLSLLYAVLDGSTEIREPHLRAALAVWDYADASARRIFGDALGLSVADTILAALRRRGPMTRTEIRDLFRRNKTEAEIDAALMLLMSAGRARRSTRPPEGGKGRPVEIWEATS